MIHFRFLCFRLVAEYPSPESLKRLDHEYSLREKPGCQVDRPTESNCSPTGAVRYWCWKIPAVCLSFQLLRPPLELSVFIASGY